MNSVENTENPKFLVTCLCFQHAAMHRASDWIHFAAIFCAIYDLPLVMKIKFEK